MANVQILVTFDGTNGSDPVSLVSDAAGNLYGTTSNGGANGYGTVFEITRNGTTGAYSSTPTILVSFDNTDGASPAGSLFADAAGNLYGTTAYGGAIGAGTVFEIARNGTTGAYSSTPTTLVSFNGSNGAVPAAGLIADAKGNLYGTTYQGGANGGGTVFEIARNGMAYSSTPTTLVTFNTTNGAYPAGSLIADAAGNLYGTTAYGGAAGLGTVFEIARNGTTGAYSSTPTTLATFNNTNGSAVPIGSLIADAKGNLYGTTVGSGRSYGTVFEIVRDGTTGAYSSTPTILVSFNETNGSNPYGSLIADAAGNLYGTTRFGGAHDDGTVFKIVRDSTTGAYNSTPATLVSFNGTNGSNPYGSLIADAAGNLYGTTSGGGAQDDGTVFEITGSGFVTCFVSGTRLRTRRGEVAVEDLVAGDLAVTAKGEARPIVWIGRRDMDCRGHHDFWPVRVAAHAFGDTQPARDLFLSPGHPILVGADAHGEGGHLVPIMCLINGTTVRRQTVDAVIYWHVELDAHDILLAENLPAESYLDWGDRAFFTEGADHALANPDFVVPGLAGRCRPVALDGPVVEAARGKLDAVFVARLAAMSVWPAEASLSLGF